MAKEDAVKFVDAARSTDAIRKGLERARTPDDIVKVGHDNGFEFSASEFKAVKDELDVALRAPVGELSDGELEQAAGGARTVTFVGASSTLAIKGSGGSSGVCTEGNVGGSPITCMKMPDWTTKNITCD
jgi:predicted ribosomally synthesized peptide with nif11-like leader